MLLLVGLVKILIGNLPIIYKSFQKNLNPYDRWLVHVSNIRSFETILRIIHAIIIGNRYLIHIYNIITFAVLRHYLLQTWTSNL